MAGIAAQLTTPGLDAAIAKLARLQGFELASLADAAGAILESSTRARFDSQTAADGTPWADWSDAYAAIREAHHSLLVGEGDLRDSIQSFAAGGDVLVGSNLVYAAIQNLGGKDTGANIPERPFLGVSIQDEDDLKDLVTGRLEGLLQ
ncbi:MAG: phage virion morphogenesis protein [Planktomarina sp.]